MTTELCTFATVYNYSSFTAYIFYLCFYAAFGTMINNDDKDNLHYHRYVLTTVFCHLTMQKCKAQ